MRYRLKILRGEGIGESRWQTFSSPCAAEDSVACALEELDARERLCDETGAAAERVAWECACLEKKCGACAMVISGRPALACAVSLGAAADRDGIVTLEPLKKFPRLRDLRVERRACFDALKEMQLWLENEAALTAPARRSLHYQAAACLLCGLCLEVCPSFAPGKNFAGALGAAAAFRAHDGSLSGAHRSAIAREYEKRVFAGCAKSLACRDICPAGVPVEELMARTNAAAVWHRKTDWEKEKKRT